MQDPPLLVLLKILDHLPTLDAIRYRSVCKIWRDLIDQVVLDELNLFHGQRQYTKYLQFRKSFMNPNRSISFSETSFESLVLENEKFFHLFRNLKKFSFEQSFDPWSDNYEELEELINSFVNLEHLYLVGTSLLSIKLAKLKTFDSSCFNDIGDAQMGKKLLDCPELQALAIDWEETEPPALNCPKLRYLKYFHYSPWVSQLDSLEVLNLREFRTNPDILGNHPKLHTLNVFNVEKAVLEELVRSKRELGRDHLKVFVKSLPVNGEVLKAFDEIFKGKWMSSMSFPTKKGVEFYGKHEQEFRDDFFVFNEYSGIGIAKETFAKLKLLTDRTQIFKRIRRVHALFIRGPSFCRDEELIDLIKQMPNVKSLSFTDVSLDQTFFDQLPTILRSLNILRVRKNSKTLSNLSFLLRFPELNSFTDLGQKKYFDENSRILSVIEVDRSTPDFSKE